MIYCTAPKLSMLIAIYKLSINSTLHEKCLLISQI